MALGWTTTAVLPLAAISPEGGLKAMFLYKIKSAGERARAAARHRTGGHHSS
jgi:hypothetical protein